MLSFSALRPSLFPAAHLFRFFLSSSALGWVQGELRVGFNFEAEAVHNQDDIEDSSDDQASSTDAAEHSLALDSNVFKSISRRRNDQQVQQQLLQQQQQASWPAG